MDENSNSDHRRNNSVSADDSMDLLSLTLPSLDLRNSTSQESFLGLKEEDATSQLSMERQRSSSVEEGTRALEKEQSKELRTINLDELAWHDTPDNCWVAIYDFVYDCTDFLKKHPGGLDVILEYAGRDATLTFVSAGHSSTARKTLERYLIGELPPEERIFRVPDGVKVPEF